MNAFLHPSVALFLGLSGLALGSILGFFAGGSLGQYFFGPWGWLLGLFIGLFLGNWIGWCGGLFFGKIFNPSFADVKRWTQFFSVLNGTLLGMLVGMLIGSKIATFLNVDPASFFSFFSFWFGGLFAGAIAGEFGGSYFGNQFLRWAYQATPEVFLETFSWRKIVVIFISALGAIAIAYPFAGESGVITASVLGIFLGRIFWQIYFAYPQRRNTNTAISENHSPE